MFELTYQLWLGIGLFCVVAEMLIPGLVVIFIGLGAFTVALGMHFQYIHNFTSQLITFFSSSIIYIFTIRLFIISFFPNDSKKENINEDENVIGQIVEVSESILPEKEGRIIHSDSTWQARTKNNEEIIKGEQARIIGRDNITWLVEKV